MDDWTGLATAVAAIGTLVVAVIALSSNLVSRAIDKRDKRLEETIKGQGKRLEEAIRGQGKRLEHYETSNGTEHARLEAKIDKVSALLQEVRDIVIRLDDRQGTDRKRQQVAD